MDVYLNALGIVTALGLGKKATLDGLIAGRTDGIVEVDGISSDGSPKLFGLVDIELPEAPQALGIFASRNLQLALAALGEIESDVRRAVREYGAGRVAMIAASSTAGIASGEDAIAEYFENGEIPAGYDFCQQEMGMVAESIARYFGMAGPALTVSTACSSGAKAFGSGRRLIRAGLADAVLVGGVDSLCRLTVNGFDALSVLSKERCLPFSVNRSGTVLGEGAAFFLMTREKGGARFAGLGESSDAYNITAPEPAGAGALAAMRAAIDEAGISIDDIGYVNLHGTGTVQNDAMESAALSRLGGADVPSGSTKPLVGHILGAAGSVETACCWLLLSELNSGGRLPPHVWDGAVDPELAPLRFTTSSDRLPSTGPAYCMSNSYAFGGSNASVIIGRAV